MVGQGYAAHTGGYRLVDKFRYRGFAVKKTVLRMDVKMRELYLTH
jgi:hypothetical protein